MRRPWCPAQQLLGDGGADVGEAEIAAEGITDEAFDGVIGVLAFPPMVMLMRMAIWAVISQSLTETFSMPQPRPIRIS